MNIRGNGFVGGKVCSYPPEPSGNGFFTVFSRGVSENETNPYYDGVDGAFFPYFTEEYGIEVCFALKTVVKP